MTTTEVIMHALTYCGARNGDGDPEWYRDDARTVLNALRDAGYVIINWRTLADDVP